MIMMFGSYSWLLRQLVALFLLEPSNITIVGGVELNYNDPDMLVVFLPKY